MEERLADRPMEADKLDSSSPSEDDAPSRSGPRRGCRRYVILAMLAFLAGAGGLVWYATRPVDITPPEAKIFEVEPDKPLFDENKPQVTFVFRDDEGDCPTFYMFEGEDDWITAGLINGLRGTPDKRGVRVHLEALRLNRGENDPDKLQAQVVGIKNEMKGDTPISLSKLQSGEPLALEFHGKIEELLNCVVYKIGMSIQYDSKTQQLSLSNASGTLQWNTPFSEASDDGRLEETVIGRKGKYDEKPLLDF
jgi:hypothetical protein